MRFFNSILVSILQGGGVLWANDMSKSCFFREINMKRENVNIEFESLLVRFWEGTISDGEMGLLQDMLAASPERMKEFKGLQALQLLLSRKAQPGKFDVQAALAKVKREIRRKRLRLVQRWAYAAGIALVMGLGGWLIWQQDRGMEAVGTNQTVVAKSCGEAGKVFLEVEENKQVELQPDTLKTVMGLYEEVSSKEGLPEVELEPQWRRLFTMEGATYSVILADGTKVWLNADSELKYPDYFSGGKREVYLEGEAYFEVAKDAGHPFEVHVDGMAVVVLGTAFNVKGYPEEEEVSVTLVNGGVKLMEESRELARLTPLQEFRMDMRTSEYEVCPADLQTALAWRNNMFVFESEPLAKIIGQLSRWYGVYFELDKRLEGYMYSGNISRSEPLEEVLHILSLTNEIKFSIMTGTNKIKVSLKE